MSSQAVASFTISTKTYMSEPIQCWVPAQYSDAWEQYSENYCFVQNTYFVALNRDIPNEYHIRKEREIGETRQIRTFNMKSPLRLLSVGAIHIGASGCAVLYAMSILAYIQLAVRCESGAKEDFKRKCL